jgi:hypothetical protein
MRPPAQRSPAAGITHHGPAHGDGSIDADRTSEITAAVDWTGAAAAKSGEEAGAV